MDAEPVELNDLVFFELPTCADTASFYARIRPRWQGWTTGDDDVWLVAAEVAVDDTDLALLLREVEAYVAETGLHAIRYWLDGRAHIMEAPALDRAA
jgi:hypothetical protein